MNIYLLTNNDCIDYDTYDSYVVVAKDRNTARVIRPDSTK